MSGRLAIIAALALAPAGCGAPGGTGAGAGGDAAMPPRPGVHHWGALHAVMMENDTAAVVALDTLTPDSTLHAVGAAAGLRGEITVLGGAVWRATPGDGDVATSTVSDSSAAEAALLIAASVPAWREIAIDAPIPFDSLDARVAALAGGAGVDVSQPFAFVIEGPLSALEWHVVDGRRMPEGASGHAAHLEATVRRRLEHVSAGLVGFYSTAHEGVWTHRGAHTHVHAVIPAAYASGHVDHVVVEPGATLKVPAP